MHWTMADMILDLVQNSVEAGAKIITLEVEERSPTVNVLIRDNGCGMDDTRRSAALDPFFSEPGKHPSRRVGLGLPFLLQTVDQTGGSWELRSEPGQGTDLRFCLDLDNMDTPPVGDLASLIVDLMCFEGDYDLQVDRRWNAGEPPDPQRVYRISRKELCDVLGDITNVGSRGLARELLSNWELAIRENDSTSNEGG